MSTSDYIFALRSAELSGRDQELPCGCRYSHTTQINIDVRTCRGEPNVLADIFKAFMGTMQADNISSVLARVFMLHLCNITSGDAFVLLDKYAEESPDVLTTARRGVHGTFFDTVIRAIVCHDLQAALAIARSGYVIDRMFEVTPDEVGTFTYDNIIAPKQELLASICEKFNIHGLVAGNTIADVFTGNVRSVKNAPHVHETRNPFNYTNSPQIMCRAVYDPEENKLYMSLLAYCALVSGTFNARDMTVVPESLSVTHPDLPASDLEFLSMCNTWFKHAPLNPHKCTLFIADYQA